MKDVRLLSLLLAATLATGCAFENSTKLFSPIAPSGDTGVPGDTTAGGSGPTSATTGGGSSSEGGSSSSGPSSSGGSTTVPASGFAGAWDSSAIAGLPLGNCSDVKWIITEQTASSAAGSVTANCASGVTVSANLTGTLQNENVIELTAAGTLTALGLPCQFNLTGTGTRQSEDTMTVNYSGSYCLGTVSGTETLRRPTATPPAPPEAPAEPEPPAPPAPPPPPPVVESAKCNSSKGSDIAECIEDRYPEYGRKGVSLSQRKANMQFLRDRLIEHATCKGLRVGHNLKRGGPEISNDFITFFTGGRWVGVDIASGYDDTKTTLNMMWYQHGASSNWGHPYYKDYGPVSCP